MKKLKFSVFIILGLLGVIYGLFTKVLSADGECRELKARVWNAEYRADSLEYEILKKEAGDGIKWRVYGEMKRGEVRD